MEEINMPSYVFREFRPFKHTFPNASTLKNKDVCNLYYEYILRIDHSTLIAPVFIFNVLKLFIKPNLCNTILLSKCPSYISAVTFTLSIMDEKVSSVLG